MSPSMQRRSLSAALMAAAGLPGCALLAPAPHEAAPPPNRLPGVRTEFLATLSDIEGDDAENLRRRIHDARSLRELWHLRAETYRVVGVHHSQSEAEQRLSLLNRHFPTRAPRSQFATL